MVRTVEAPKARKDSALLLESVPAPVLVAVLLTSPARASLQVVVVDLLIVSSDRTSCARTDGDDGRAWPLYTPKNELDTKAQRRANSLDDAMRARTTECKRWMR